MNAVNGDMFPSLFPTPIPKFEDRSKHVCDNSPPSISDPGRTLQGFTSHATSTKRLTARGHKFIMAHIVRPMMQNPVLAGFQQVLQQARLRMDEGTITTLRDLEKVLLLELGHVILPCVSREIPVNSPCRHSNRRDARLRRISDCPSNSSSAANNSGHTSATPTSAVRKTSPTTETTSSTPSTRSSARPKSGSSSSEKNWTASCRECDERRPRARPLRPRALVIQGNCRACDRLGYIQCER